MTKTKPTQKNPCKKGMKYKVAEDFSSLSDQFKKDEVLTFEKEAYSHYDGITAYIFRDKSNSFKPYDVADSENLRSDLFIELKTGTKKVNLPTLITIMVLVALVGIFARYLWISGEMLNTLKTKPLLAIGSCAMGGLFYIIKEYFRKKR